MRDPKAPFFEGLWEKLFENRRTPWAIAVIAVLAVLVTVVTMMRPDPPPSQAGGKVPAVGAVGPSSVPTPTVLGATGQPVRYGVFMGDSEKEVAKFESWWGQPVKDVTHFAPRQTWSDIEHPDLSEWQGTNYRLIFAVPMLPASSYPTKEADMRAGARGAYDAYFTTLAQTLVRNGQENASLRIGWEFNLASWPWGINDGTVFAKYFRHVVTAMKAVPGAKFKIDWNVNNGYNPYDATKYWPGDKYVDTVGIDAYDLDQSVYALKKHYMTKSCNAACTLQKQQTAWDSVIYGGDQGLEFWTGFAAQHHKPVSLPEWGLWRMTDGHDGGGDNPFYIEQMYYYINQPRNNVAYASYFDCSDGVHDMLKTFPKAGKEFKKLFVKQPG